MYIILKYNTLKFYQYDLLYLLDKIYKYIFHKKKSCSRPTKQQEKDQSPLNLLF